MAERPPSPDDPFLDVLDAAEAFSDALKERGVNDVRDLSLTDVDRLIAGTEGLLRQIFERVKRQKAWGYADFQDRPRPRS